MNCIIFSRGVKRNLSYALCPLSLRVLEEAGHNSFFSQFSPSAEPPLCQVFDSVMCVVPAQLRLPTLKDHLLAIATIGLSIDPLVVTIGVVLKGFGVGLVTWTPLEEFTAPRTHPP